MNDLARVIRFTVNLLCEQLRGCHRNNKGRENPESLHRCVPPLLHFHLFDSLRKAQEVFMENLLDELIDCLRQRDNAFRNFRAPLSARKCDNPIPCFTSAELNREAANTLQDNR